MLVSGSNCSVWSFGEEIGQGGGSETLRTMVKYENEGEDVEEGEISDTASVEEITEEDFKQEAKASPKPRAESGNGVSVWTTQNMYKYFPAASGLYNLAWAQAVQNKPLNDIFVMDVDADEDSEAASVSGGREIGQVVVIDDSGDEMDVEKEEGELEEGEIDMDSEPVEEEIEYGNKVNGDVSEICVVEEEDLEKQVKLIRQVLGSVTAIDAEKSFESVCSQLHNSLEKFQILDFGSNASPKEHLIQLLCTAIEVVNSVFCSMDHHQKEQNTRVYSRLLSFVKSKSPPLFSPDQMKEIEVTMTSLESRDVLLNVETSDIDKVTQVNNGVNMRNADVGNEGRGLTSGGNLPSRSLAMESLVGKKPDMLSDLHTPGSSNFRGRGVLVPLLDLHKDHDADSLPSPTREAPPSFSLHKTLSFGDGIDKMEPTRSKGAHNSQNSILHPYETDAVKAVSSYQQKFNRSSFNMFDRLPSPTPSEESDDVGGDVVGEVSSSSTVCSFKTPTPYTMKRPVVSSNNMENLSSQGQVTAGNVAPLSSLSNPTMKSLSKSRDPRLRFAYSDVNLNQRSFGATCNAAKLDSDGGNLNLREQKTADEPIMDGPALKRQKNGLENSGFPANIKSSPGAGGWLEDTDTVGPQAISKNLLAGKVGTDPRKIDKGITCSTTGSGYPELTFGANGQGPATGTNTTASLPALMKDIAVNPAMLLNILKMGQQKLAEEAQQKPSDPAKTVLGAIPLVNVTPSKVSVPLQKPAESPQAPSQLPRMNKSEIICMKPRDPRRFLHGNTVKKSGSLGAVQLTANGSPKLNIQPVKDSLITEKPDDQPDMKLIPHASVAPSDIAPQFTKNLKNIANIVSVSRASTSPSPRAMPQNLSSQPVQTKLDRVDAKPVVPNSENQQNGDGSIPVMVSAPSPHNSWGDVDLLFEGYDDKQKAAIQRERARRIEEQKKMFAARKLCLVLDLDHTLLNSAKFGEVDPVHDEILRKKEELDREKQHRHLFRFPHMGMWTKLRPGIWTFLERASKIFELHVYTMGNKVYAKEMAKILDPKGTLFAGRVISKGDDGEPLDGDDRVPKTKDMEGVLGMESGVLIIDDSIRVWPHHKLNLIVVERYTYFPYSRRQFGLPGPSLLEIDHDERSEEGTIASCLAVIERIHENFFSHPSLEEVDVRAILASEQQKILANCRIVFSRVFPVGEAKPHLHPLWQTAERFGAVCTNQIDEQVTHIVANSLGTDKVNWALSTGRFLVSPCWVEASALLYRRANEQDFPIKP